MDWRNKKFWAIVAVVVLALALLLVFTNNADAAEGTGDECVPSDAWTETIHHDEVSHVVHHDAVTHVVHHEAVTHVVHHDAVTHQETVVDSEEVPEIWANFSPNHQQGEFTGPPTWPSDERGEWHVHDKIPGGHEGPDGVYQRDNPGRGNADWFFRQNHQDAVTHEVTVVDQEAWDETVVDQEAYDETVVDQEAYDEVVVDEDGWDEMIVHPAVDCPDTPDTPDTPDEPNTPVVHHNPNPPATPVNPGVPTVIDAGL